MKHLLIALAAFTLLSSELSLADTTRVQGHTFEVHGGVSILSGVHVGGRVRFLDLFILETSYTVSSLFFPGKRISFGLSFLTSESGASAISFEFVSRLLKPNYRL